VYRGIDIIGIGVHFPERLAHAHGGQELPGLGIRLNVGVLAPISTDILQSTNRSSTGMAAPADREFHAFIDCRILFKVADNVRMMSLAMTQPGRASFEDDLITSGTLNQAIR
jgi:hypothetical protein